jgi:hypothetical protein
MKKILVLGHCALGIFLLLNTPQKSLAQTPDTSFLQIGQEAGALEDQRFIDRYDYVFGTQQPARWLFKWDAANMLPALGFNVVSGQLRPESGLSLAAEYKMSKAFSLNAAYTYFFTASLDELDFSNGHALRLEPRWYFDMPRRIRAGKSANNFSGNYFGLELARVGRMDDALAGYRGASLRFGLQRRLFRHGYFDMSYGLGVRDYFVTPFNRGSRGLFGEARFGLGLALASPRPTQTPQSAYCAVFQCFREENRMWKVDLFNLFRANTLDNLQGGVRASVEQKIGQSPFSVELQARGSGYYYDYQVSNARIQSNALSAGAQLQGRYYYNLKNRIARGKSGNNLSGSYAAIQAGAARTWSESPEFLVSIGFPERTRGDEIGGGFLCGIQHRLFRRGYLDFNAGLGYTEYRTTEFQDDAASKKTLRAGWGFLSNLSVGIAF